MKRRRGSVLVIVALVGVAGCSGDDIAESIIEQAAESQGEGDVDIDLSDGEFSIETEDGSFEMTTDDEGNVVIQAEDADGNEVFSADSEDGVTQIQTEDGDATITQTGEGDDAEIVIETETDEGDATITQTGEGDDAEVVIETDEGTATISRSDSLPEDFPDLPLPDDLVVVMSQQSETPDGVSNMLVGSGSGDWESYLGELTSFLEGNGYTQQSVTTTPDGAVFHFIDPSGTVSVSGGVNDDPAAGGVSLNLFIGPN